MKRYCQNPSCDKDISHARSDARFCSSGCRGAANRQKRGGNSQKATPRALRTPNNSTPTALYPTIQSKGVDPNIEAKIKMLQSCYDRLEGRMSEAEGFEMRARQSGLLKDPAPQLKRMEHMEQLLRKSSRKIENLQEQVDEGGRQIRTLKRDLELAQDNRQSLLNLQSQLKQLNTELHEHGHRDVRKELEEIGERLLSHNESINQASSLLLSLSSMVGGG